MALLNYLHYNLFLLFSDSASVTHSLLLLKPSSRLVHTHKPLIQTVLWEKPKISCVLRFVPLFVTVTSQCVLSPFCYGQSFIASAWSVSQSWLKLLCTPLYIMTFRERKKYCISPVCPKSSTVLTDHMCSVNVFWISEERHSHIM